jgi:hypothetical protein
MRYIFSILLITLLLSCRKENIQILDDKITGKWELSHRWGTIVGINESYPAGNGAILQFSNNNFYQYLGTQLVQSGTFALVEDTASYTVKGHRITFNTTNGNGFEKFAQIADTALILSDYGSDAEHKQYKRLP